MSQKIAYKAPPISSLATLATTLSCDINRLKHVISNIGDYYTDFQIAKKSGGERQICAPKPVLKTLQRRINSRIFYHCVFPTYLQGSIRDNTTPRDFVSNAEIHSQAVSVIAADIKNYYPSIKPGHVKEVFKYLFRFPDEVSDALVSLTTLNGAVPQGAPTSSYLANLIFFDSEYKLVEELTQTGFKYTRLIDDITVSSVKPINKEKKEWVVKKILAILKSKDLELHKGKLKISHTNTYGSQVVVTGLWIDRGHPRLSKKERDNIRSAVYQVDKDSSVNGRTSPFFHKSHESVSGKVALMARLGHTQASKLRSDLYKIRPTYDKTDANKIEQICRKFHQKHGQKSETHAYTRRFHRLMRYIGILGRTDIFRAYKLRKLLLAYPPKHKVSDFLEM